jgi:hypothetical protein
MAAYTLLYPFYAEYCAVSQISKKPGFGADIRGEIGGHAVFYLNGACRKADDPYPVLQVCDGGDGAGLSMNAHFSNAKWVATPGHAFFLDGGLPANGGLSRADYATVQARAMALGLYDAVTFHSWVFADKPAGMAERDWKYEVSVGTDYGISLGRGRFCARVPVTRAQMAVMVDFLNGENAPYRRGERVFHWNVFQDNCIHLAHNALAAAGIWQSWPSHDFLPWAMLDFPVPRNTFVNLMRRTNGPDLADPGRLYRDPAARLALLRFGTLPVMPGALANARPPLRPNAVYDVARLKLIFYDDPLLGHYQERSDAILADPRTTDLRANLAYFAGTYAQIQAARRPAAWWLLHEGLTSAAQQQDFTAFYAAYTAYIDRQAETVRAQQARLEGRWLRAG